MQNTTELNRKTKCILIFMALLLFQTAVNGNDVINSTKNVTSTLENNSVGDETYILNRNTEVKSTKNDTLTRENNSAIDGSYILILNKNTESKFLKTFCKFIL